MPDPADLILVFGPEFARLPAVGMLNQSDHPCRTDTAIPDANRKRTTPMRPLVFIQARRLQPF